MGAGVIGPPWRRVPELSAAALSLDPPALVNCDLHAVFHQRTRRLVRCGSLREASLCAQVIAAREGGEATVLRGGVQLRSGTWYFPTEVDRKRVSKQLDPLDRKDRATIAARIQRSLLRPSRGSENRMLAAALDTLKVDWKRLSETQIGIIFAEVIAAARTIPAAAGVQAAVKRSEPVIVAAATGSRRAATLGIPSKLGVRDEAAARRISRDMPFFMRNDYGRRAGSWAERDAQRIIARGVRDGLDDIVIGRDLHKALGKRLKNRSEHYFRIVASSSIVRSSSLGQLSGYRDAGLDRYEWSSVLDEATCNVCAFLHGKQFEVASAVGQFDRARAAPDPEAGLAEMPWYREFEGNIHVGPKARGEPIGPVVARIIESGVGRAGQTGTFAQVRAPAGSGGTETPPAHGLCRCVTLPVF